MEKRPLLPVSHRTKQMTITANAVMVNCHSGYINWETIWDTKWNMEKRTSRKRLVIKTLAYM
jgi:hypothetical protein